MFLNKLNHSFVMSNLIEQLTSFYQEGVSAYKNNKEITVPKIVKDFANLINAAYSDLGIGEGWFKPEYYSEFNGLSKLLLKNVFPAIEAVKVFDAIATNPEAYLNELLDREEKVYGSKSELSDAFINGLKSLNDKSTEEVLNIVVNNYLNKNFDNPLMKTLGLASHIGWAEFVKEFEPERLDPTNKKYSGDLFVPYTALPEKEQVKDLVISGVIADELLRLSKSNYKPQIRFSALGKALTEAGIKTSVVVSERF